MAYVAANAGDNPNRTVRTKQHWPLLNMDLDEDADFAWVKLGLSFSNGVRVTTCLGHMIGQTAPCVGSAKAVGKVWGQNAEGGACRQ